jgi:hypothetical protein
MRENHETLCILAGAVSRYRRKRLTKCTNGLIDADSVVSLLHSRSVGRPRDDRVRRGGSDCSEFLDFVQQPLLNEPFSMQSIYQDPS